MFDAGKKGMISPQAVITPRQFWDAHPTISPGALQLKILLSYHYFKTTDFDVLIPQKFARPYPQIFIDSGAFSAYTQGVTIDWKDYAAWLKRWRHWFSVMANLDVIGSWQGTAANQARLEDAGLPVLPVFHTGEPWHILEHLLTRYDYIALGGMVPYMTDWKRTLMPWLIRCFKLAAGRVGYHGFGCTTWPIMKALPWRSVDSSSWGQGFRYGQIPLFDFQQGRFFECKIADRKSIAKVAPLIRRLGFDPLDFLHRARNTRVHNAGIAALSYCLASDWLQKHWRATSQLFLVEVPPLQDTSVGSAAICLVDGKQNCGDTSTPASVLSSLATPT